MASGLHKLPHRRFVVFLLAAAVAANLITVAHAVATPAGFMSFWNNLVRSPSLSHAGTRSLPRTRHTILRISF
uniref:Putative secreted peptide n=1 Tax=Anopheles braziliensis TaxID=58242 RepID=A0A2M3ZWC8_9DIPT